jgi:hypothetical protein
MMNLKNVKTPPCGALCANIIMTTMVDVNVTNMDIDKMNDMEELRAWLKSQQETKTEITIQNVINKLDLVTMKNGTITVSQYMSLTGMEKE